MIAPEDPAIAALATKAEPFLKKLLGPSFAELGDTLADRIRVFRLRRSLKLLDSVQRMVVEAGVQPRQVQLSLVLPLLESASLEDNEDLASMWAALLANAVVGDSTAGVAQMHVRILQQLSPLEARMLQLLANAGASRAHLQGEDPVYLSDLESKLEIEASTAFLALLGVVRLDLCEARKQHRGGVIDSRTFKFDPSQDDPKTIMIFLSWLGDSLVQACTPPSGKSNR